MMNYKKQQALEERTKDFSVEVIKIVRPIKINLLNRNIISQLLRSATNVGANYCEANATVSKNDFRNKIYICRKEIQETKYWIELLSETNPEIKQELRILWKEAHKLTLIFSKISGTLKNSLENNK